jgi:hypothetical protein
MTRIEGANMRTLRERIDSMLYAEVTVIEGSVTHRITPAPVSQMGV